jgi:hypothetical protein
MLAEWLVMVQVAWKTWRRMWFGRVSAHFPTILVILSFIVYCRLQVGVHVAARYGNSVLPCNAAGAFWKDSSVRFLHGPDIRC